MPTITLLSSGPADAPSPLPVDLETAIAAAQTYAQQAHDALVAVPASASAAVASVVADAEDARDAAAASAAAALTSKNNALTAAGTASTQSSMATLQAGNAATSATTAAGSAAAAAGSASAAATSKTGADTSAAAAAGSATAAATSKTGADSSAAAAAGSAATALTYQTNTQAARDLAQSYMSSASQAALSAAAVTGLLNLSGVNRCIALVTDAAAVFLYDTTKDTDAGAWRDKVPAVSWMTEALNTATRGAKAQFPKVALIVARNVANGPVVTIYDAADPTLPMWMVFNGVGSSGLFGSGSSYNVTCVSALNGTLLVGQTGFGLGVVDFISDTGTNRYLGQLLSVPNLANRNITTTTQTGTATSFGSANINSVAATIAPHTPPNPLRCGLPNPTVAVGSAGVANVIRWDGVVTSSDTGAGVQSVCFDDKGNLWKAHFSAVYVVPPSMYQSASWPYQGVAAWGTSQTGVGTSPKLCPCGPGMVAVQGATGIARIKLDPANPANSLINIKTSTYDTGWMVLGKTVLAMAESSAQLSTISGTPLVDDAMSYADNTALAAGGWVTGTGITPNGSDVTFQYSGAQVGLNKLVTGLDIGDTYQVLATLSATIGTPTSSDLQARAGTTTGNGSMGILNQGSPPVGSEYVALTFVAGAASAYVGITAQVSGKGATLDRMRIRKIAADRSGSGQIILPTGAPTRAIVASGADTAGYGVGGGKYFELAANAALDFGTGDWGFAFDGIFPPSTASYFPIFCYGNGAGAGGGTTGWGLYINGNTGAVTLDMAGGYVAFNSGAIPLSTTAVTSVEIAVRSGYAELKVNGVQLQRLSTSGASATCVGATLRIGDWGNSSNTHSSATIGNVGPTWLGNIKLLNYARGNDMAAFAYADQKGRFVANSISLLSGATPQGIAYDPDTDQLAIANSTGGVDIFSKSTKAANDNSAAASANVFAYASLPASWSAYSNASLGSVVTPPSGWGSKAWALNDTASNVQHYAQANPSFPLSASPQTLAVPLKIGAVGFAFVQIGNSYAWFNLSTGVGSNAGGGATINTSVNLGNGWWLCSITAPSSTGSSGQVAIQPATAAGGGLTYTGTGGAALYFGEGMIIAGSSVPGTFVPALSNSANAKAVAFAGGDLVAITAAGVDAFIAAKPGLGETAKASGAAKRAFYDPTFGVFSLVTTDATPTVAVSTPIPEGKAFRIRDTVSFVQVGGVATEKAAYVAEALVTRDLGGNVVVSATTTTINETTVSLDYVIQANTTAQTCEGKPTGKASTRGMWVIEREVYDAGLMIAA